MNSRILHFLIPIRLITMRLINCKSFLMEEFFGSNIPAYAILSHTWANEEVSFLEFTTDLEAARLKAGFRKIGFTCRQAIADGLDYAWVDTSCIDKSSSAELSEAINSMFTWYKNAFICYAYLSDVKINNGQYAEQFRESRWFQRGWTLQELIAPGRVIFYDVDWNRLGKKKDLAQLIHVITRIHKRVLKYGIASYGLHRYCIAERMAWASQRITTRIEDMAYCLLGIFNINMPLLYGEGDQAFRRLQQEIVKVVDDDSIFAWGRQIDNVSFESIAERMCGYSTNHGFFARSPRDFTDGHSIKYAIRSISPYTVTNQGLEIEFPLIPIIPQPQYDTYSNNTHSIGLLNCKSSDSSALLGILLVHSTRSNEIMTRVAIPTDPLGAEGVPVTLLVRPRLATQAVLTKVIVTDLAWVSAPQWVTRLDQKILVNQSQQLRDLDFIATGGCSLWGWRKKVFNNTSTWDSVASVLTVEGIPSVEYMCFLTFENRNEFRVCSGFTVALLGAEAIVCQGLSLSQEEKLRCYDYLVSQDRDTDRPKDVILTSDDGRRWIPSITVGQSKQVVSWAISHVDVDVVETTGSLDNDDPVQSR
jgi:hypothetical protein